MPTGNSSYQQSPAFLTDEISREAGTEMSVKDILEGVEGDLAKGLVMTETEIVAWLEAEHCVTRAAGIFRAHDSEDVNNASQDTGTVGGPGLFVSFYGGPGLFVLAGTFERIHILSARSCNVTSADT